FSYVASVWIRPALRRSNKDKECRRQTQRRRYQRNRRPPGCLFEAATPAALLRHSQEVSLAVGRQSPWLSTGARARVGCPGVCRCNFEFLFHSPQSRESFPGTIDRSSRVAKFPPCLIRGDKRPPNTKCAERRDFRAYPVTAP